MLRITLDGEQRAFGILEGLDCKDHQVEFVVRTKDGAAVRAIGRFVDVQVVSFRQGSLGNLLCGPQTVLFPALLTWATSGELRRAIAVELLPDGFVP